MHLQFMTFAINMHSENTYPPVLECREPDVAWDAMHASTKLEQPVEPNGLPEPV